VRESSGVATSSVYPGEFYTFNDSGDFARVFRFDSTGKVMREYRIRNAKNIDWEDMAGATLGGKPYLFVGDIGDNSGRRSFITIYRVPEPTSRRVSADQTYTLSYPDGAHNAETLLVHPITGDITIVTKASTHPAGVYFLPRPAKTGPYLLQKLGEIDIASTFGAGKLVTGGAWSHDGRHVVLRTYLAAYEYPAADPKSWFNENPVRITPNLELQSEGITYSQNDDALITTSEGSPCPVSIIPIE
jgi:hypothetical protein